MNVEKQVNNQTENKVPLGDEKKIHQTHFPVLKIPLPDNGNHSAYEWVRSGNGRLRLVPRKTVPRV